MNRPEPGPVERILARLRGGSPGSPAAADGPAVPLPPLSPEQSSQLEQLVEQANTTLENAASEAASRAFNLGCLAGLLPAAILLLSMAMVTGWSLIGIAMVLVLTVFAMVAFANLAAAIARVNSVRRTYQQTVQPEVASALSRSGLQPGHFAQAAHQSLPPAAPLLAFLDPPGAGL